MACHCLEIHTKQQRWVVPDNPSLLCSLIQCQHIRAEDLVFASAHEEKKFIRHILLLAAEDFDGVKLSPIAKLGRDMIHAQCSRALN